MKALLRLILLITTLLGSALLAYGQTCEECKTYNGQWNKIPYRYCDPATNTIVTICTRDPYTPPAPYQNHKILKLCLPLEFGTNITYDNTYAPRLNLGPWTEQIWLGRTQDGFEYRDADMPDLIQAAADFWQDICTPHNNSDCQSCPMKIAWTRDVAKMQDDIKNPVHSSTPLTGNCKYDCSKFYILLNGTSGYTQFNGAGKPSRYFFTRGASTTLGYSGLHVANSDMRTEMIHRIGIMLGFGESEAAPDCFIALTVMSTGKYNQYPYLERQGNRFGALSNTSDINPPGYTLTPRISTIAPNRDICQFKLLYCCVSTTSSEENTNAGSDITVFPNPTEGEITIRGLTSRGCKVAIVDAMGREMWTTQSFDKDNESTDVKLDVRSLASGSYTLVVWNLIGQTSRRIVVLK